MPASTSDSTRSADHGLTGSQLILGALRKVGNNNPSGLDKSYAREALNDILKGVSQKGYWLWGINQTPTSLSTVASTKIYTTASDVPDGIANDICRIEAAWIDEGSNSREYLDIIRTQEALFSYDNEQSGEPDLIYLDRKSRPEDNQIILLPIPSGVVSVQYIYRRWIYDFDEDTETADLPQEAFHPLKTILASELSDEYHLPLPERQWLKARADEQLRELRGAMADNGTIRRATPDYY